MIDLLVIIIYFVFALGIGFYLKRFAKSGDVGLVKADPSSLHSIALP